MSSETRRRSKYKSQEAPWGEPYLGKKDGIRKMQGWRSCASGLARLPSAILLVAGGRKKGTKSRRQREEGKGDFEKKAMKKEARKKTRVQGSASRGSPFR